MISPAFNALNGARPWVLTCLFAAGDLVTTIGKAHNKTGPQVCETASTVSSR